MKLPLQISFHNVEATDEAERRIRAEAAALDKFCDRIMSCRVVVDVPHRHHLTGNDFQVRIVITVPGEELAISHEPGKHDPYYKNLDVAIRDTFDSAARRLEDYVRRRPLDVKRHETLPRGRVSKLFATSGYGFITTADGREVYFDSNSVLDRSFADLHIGTEVVFAEELGDKGPQASSVSVL